MSPKYPSRFIDVKEGEQNNVNADDVGSVLPIMLITCTRRSWAAPLGDMQCHYPFNAAWSFINAKYIILMGMKMNLV